MMNTWTTKYHQREEFTALFLNEQDFIDAMFIYIIMYNFGIFLDHEELL